MQRTHRKTTILTLAFAAVIGATAAAFTGCTSILGDYEVGPDNSEGGTGGGANGAVCTTAAQCGSGFCSDGVCCESACTGTCQTCNGAEKGKCTPVVKGQDPDKECKATPREDAGAAPEPDAEAFGDGGIAPDAQAVDEDGGSQVNVPDAGFTSSDDKCAGSCNGAGACEFPKTETTCGTKFCNTRAESGRFACDGKGRCELELAACQSFTCEGDECRKTCAEQNDCQKSHFCNPMGICQERLSNGITCGNPDQCKSGFCVTGGAATGVCCNSECNFPGADCKKPMLVGQCKCATDCGTGSCRLFYKDADGDGYGDKNAAFPGTATVACDNLPPPATYSATKDDCDDGDARAHPGQTEYFSDKTTTKLLNDFNCDGIVTKETKEYPGATCYVCGVPKTCSSSTTCGSRDSSQSRLTCDLYSNPVFCLPGQTCNPYSCGYSTKVSNTAGFTTTVDCGVTSGTYTTCGKCTGVIGAPPSSAVSKQQRCR